jgi:hypothetical protein
MGLPCEIYQEEAVGQPKKHKIGNCNSVLALSTEMVEAAGVESAA